MGFTIYTYSKLLIHNFRLGSTLIKLTDPFSRVFHCSISITTDTKGMGEGGVYKSFDVMNSPRESMKAVGYG